MTSAQGQNQRTPEVVLRDRCAAAGYLVWSTDAQGRITNEPQVAEPGTLLLRSNTFNSLLEEHIQGWNGRVPPDTDDLWPGCRLVPMASKCRGKVQGYTIVMCMEPSSLDHAEFEILCARAMIDPQSARESLQDYAQCSPREAERLSMLTGRMQEDLSRAVLDERTIDGFTNHLGDAYEQMALLHELGRSMTRFTRPGEFFSTVLERLADTLHFRWFSVLLSESADLPAEIAGGIFCYGMGQVNKIELASSLWARSKQLTVDDSCQVLSVSSLGLLGGGQLAVQYIMRNDRVVAILVAGGKRGDDPQISSYDTKLIASVAGYVGTFLDNSRLEARRNAMLVGSIQALTAIVDAKDHYTLGHSERVALLGAQLAQEAGFPPDIAERVHLAGLLHDVGKVGVPEVVLCKTSRLTDDEFDIIKKHPKIGYDILKGIPDFDDILGGVLTHHERWDGRGYPDRLAGESIPLFGRILCLADSFDAMSSNRAYRPALPREKVLAEIRSCAGGQFDPELAPIFAKMDFTAFDEMLAVNATRSAQFRAA
jgi:HD-GYP domain-containing protein (c-di-GMP phosphodiesterase class II)